MYVFCRDWQYSKWRLDGLAKDNKVPDSCCKTEGLGCGVRDHPSNIYYTGCIHKLSDTVRNHLGYLTISGLGLCILQVCLAYQSVHKIQFGCLMFD